MKCSAIPAGVWEGKTYRETVLRRRYGEVYQAVFDAEPVAHRKEGRARFAANTDLRELVEMHCPNKLEGYPLESY